MRQERPSRLYDALRGTGYLVAVGMLLFATALAVAAVLVWALT